ncbi:MAG: BsuPI-related putative proteinase inhibitor [Gemmatimonadota bacterium]
MRRWTARAAVLVVGAVAACTSSSEFTSPEGMRAYRTAEGVVYRADTAIMESFPVQLRPQLTIRNEGESGRTIRFPDGCIMLLRVYREESRSGSPVWDEARTVGCTQAVQEFTVAAGDSTVIRQRTISAAEILGDSLPPGRYYFTVVLRPDWQPLELAAGEAELAK